MKGLELREMVRPGGYTVVQRDGVCELAIAQFFESVSPNLYQSPEQAKLRAEKLIAVLEEG